MAFANTKLRITVELGILLAVFGAVVGGLIIGGGWLADRALMAVPRSVDLKLGRLGAAATGAMFPACDNPRPRVAVQAIVARLMAAAGPDAGPVVVTVAATKDVNAFALPGGAVTVLQGLLDKLDPVDGVDQLAGVLAHEIGHVVRRHHIRNLGRSLGIGVLTTAVFGDLDALTGSLVGAADRLTALSFSRQQEADADDFGARLAHRAGFQPAALGKFLQALEGPALPKFLQDHPPGVDRLRSLMALAARLGPVPKIMNAPAIPVTELRIPCGS